MANFVVNGESNFRMGDSEVRFRGMLEFFVDCY